MLSLLTFSLLTHKHLEYYDCEKYHTLYLYYTLNKYYILNGKIHGPCELSREKDEFSALPRQYRQSRACRISSVDKRTTEILQQIRTN